MGRWKRVSLLRSTSSHAVKLGYEGDIVKYARNQRYNTKTQRIKMNSLKKALE